MSVVVYFSNSLDGFYPVIDLLACIYFF